MKHLISSRRRNALLFVAAVAGILTIGCPSAKASDDNGPELDNDKLIELLAPHFKADPRVYDAKCVEKDGKGPAYKLEKAIEAGRYHDGPKKTYIFVATVGSIDTPRMYKNGCNGGVREGWITKENRNLLLDEHTETFKAKVPSKRYGTHYIEAGFLTFAKMYFTKFKGKWNLRWVKGMDGMTFALEVRKQCVNKGSVDSDEAISRMKEIDDTQKEIMKNIQKKEIAYETERDNQKK